MSKERAFKKTSEGRARKGLAEILHEEKFRAKAVKGKGRQKARKGGRNTGPPEK